MPLFVLWGPGHLGAVLLTLIVPLALAWWARRDRSGYTPRIVGCGCAALLLAESVAKLIWVNTTLDRTWIEMMPLHLCDFALFACVVAGLTQRQLPYELAYFWGLAGTLQGLITPDLAYDFPSAHFLFFFISHGGIVGTVIFLSAGTDLRPHWSSVPRAYAGIIGYALIAGGYNAAFGTNFGYLRAKPAIGSLLDFFGDWPWYIVSLAVAGAGLFTLLYLPWAVADRARTRRAAVPAA